MTLFHDFERVIPEPRRVPLQPVSLLKRSAEGFPCYWCGVRPDEGCDHREAIEAKPRPRLEGDARPVRPDQRETGISYHRRAL